MVSVLDPKQKEAKDNCVFKSWRMAADDIEPLRQLNTYHCPGKTDKQQHEPCQGELTKATEGYTDKMVHIIHSAWKQSCINGGCKALPVNLLKSVRGGGEPISQNHDDMPSKSIQSGDVVQFGSHPEIAVHIPGDRGVRLPPSFSYCKDWARGEKKGKSGPCPRCGPSIETCCYGF